MHPHARPYFHGRVYFFGSCARCLLFRLDGGGAPSPHKAVRRVPGRRCRDGGSHRDDSGEAEHSSSVVVRSSGSSSRSSAMTGASAAGGGGGEGREGGEAAE